MRTSNPFLLPLSFSFKFSAVSMASVFPQLEAARLIVGYVNRVDRVCQSGADQVAAVAVVLQRLVQQAALDPPNMKILVTLRSVLSRHPTS